jgi:ADP-ribose pyrophosphatase YjhB (NUDIX family)
MEDYLPYLRKKIGHASCMAVGVTALIVNKKGEILLEKRKDNGLFCLPGGALDYEEKILDGVHREVLEETGLSLHDFQLFLIESGPETTLVYPNQDITNYVDFVFFSPYEDCLLPAQHDQESTEVFFCPLTKLPDKNQMLRGCARIIEKYVQRNFSLTLD